MQLQLPNNNNTTKIQRGWKKDTKNDNKWSSNIPSRYLPNDDAYITKCMSFRVIVIFYIIHKINNKFEFSEMVNDKRI